MIGSFLYSNIETKQSKEIEDDFKYDIPIQTLKFDEKYIENEAFSVPKSLKLNQNSHLNSNPFDYLRESVVNDIMKSQEEEDINNYGFRAYLAIKNSALNQNNDWNNSLLMSVQG